MGGPEAVLGGSLPKTGFRPQRARVLVFFPIPVGRAFFPLFQRGRGGLPERRGTRPQTPPRGRCRRRRVFIQDRPLRAGHKRVDSPKIHM